MSNVAKVTVYKCSGCNYMSNDRSNMVRHVDVCLTDASAETVLVEIQFPGTEGTNVLQGRLVQSRQGDTLPRGPFPLRKFAERLLATTTDLIDVEQRVKMIYHENHGESIRKRIMDAEDGIKLFHRSLLYIIGYKAPKNLRSVCIIVTMKGKKYLAWKLEGTVLVEELSNSSRVKFLREAYKTFYSVMVAHALQNNDICVRGDANNISCMCSRVINMEKHPDIPFNIEDLLLGKKKERILLKKISSIDMYLDTQQTTRDILLAPV